MVLIGTTIQKGEHLATHHSPHLVARPNFVSFCQMSPFDVQNIDSPMDDIEEEEEMEWDTGTGVCFLYKSRRKRWDCSVERKEMEEKTKEENKAIRLYIEMSNNWAILGKNYGWMVTLPKEWHNSYSNGVHQEPKLHVPYVTHN